MSRKLFNLSEDDMPVLAVAPAPPSGGRLRLKPHADPTGHVDGAWWPRSRDLAQELPELLRVLGVRLGRVSRVVYRSGEWAAAPARALIAGRRVVLDDSYLQPPDTIRMEGGRGRRHTLLVVPPHRSPDGAHEAMMAAAARDDRTSVAHLLDILDAAPAGRAEEADDRARWDTDGGAVGARPEWGAPRGRRARARWSRPARPLLH